MSNYIAKIHEQEKHARKWISHIRTRLDEIESRLDNADFDGEPHPLCPILYESCMHLNDHLEKRRLAYWRRKDWRKEQARQANKWKEPHT